MDDWGSSVWATPPTPAKPPGTLVSPGEKSPDSPTAPKPFPSQSQTLSFVDDAFDDKSAPPTPAFFPPPKPAASAFDTSDAFDDKDDGFGAPADDGFGDFDDFAAPATGQTLDDDFGDFGDFGDANGGDAFAAGGRNGLTGGVQDGFGNDGFGIEDVKASTHWQPLEVDPLPPPPELSDRLGDLLGPLWAHLRPDEFMSNEPERQVEGIAQILVTPER